MSGAQRMHSSKVHTFIMLAAIVTGGVPALAAPPASCAKKFIGEWSYAGGTTTVRANGLAYPHCAMCVSVQTWTCEGNTYYFSNSGPPGQFSATLIDANHVQGSAGIATRVGAAPAVAPRHAPAGPDLANAEVQMTAARAAEKICSYEDQTAAGGHYLAAADSYEAAGRPREAAAARALAKRADARSYACQHARQVAREKASRCESYQQQMAEAKQRSDLRAIVRLRLRAPRGCGG
jgi:hypothetical protein